MRIHFDVIGNWNPEIDEYPPIFIVDDFPCSLMCKDRVSPECITNKHDHPELFKYSRLTVVRAYFEKDDKGIYQAVSLSK